MQALTGSKNGSFRAALPEPGAIGRGPTGRIETIVVAALLLAYAIVEFVLTLGHGPWLDEAQAWLQATTLSGPLDALILPGEGHPPLWYWLLRFLSLGLDFNQARWVTLPIAIANAYLLARLLRGQVLPLAMMLFSFPLLQFWGYHFRPYGIVLACMTGAMLLDRANRPVAGTWLMALACGFHFFAGFLFAFWLVWQWQKGTRINMLTGPAVLALVFGALALISGLGNQSVGVAEGGLAEAIVRNLAWIGMVDALRTPITALATLALLVFALRRTPLILATLLALIALFSVATAAVYGKYLWHAAFMTMLCFMAFALTGFEKRKDLLFALLMTPQVVFGLVAVHHRLTNPAWQQPDLYAVIARDAGEAFSPEKQLVAWPDLAGVTMAAEHNVWLINGNGGQALGPVQWRTRQEERIDPVLRDLPVPYWLVCGDCRPVLDFLDQNGRSAHFLADAQNVDNGHFYAFRIE